MKAIIVFLALLFLASCAHLPDQDVVVKAYSQQGPVVLFMEKGYMDRDKHGKNWIYKHEFDERMKGVK